MGGMTKLGAQGERLALDHLERLGYRIEAVNWRCKLGELDLTAWDGDTLCFIEVKLRQGRQWGEPMEAVGWRKRRKLTQLALIYLNGRELPCRFDVVSVCLDGGEADVQVIAGAFDAAY